MVPKHSEHGRIRQAKLVQNWNPGKHCVWPPPEYEDLSSMFPRHALPGLGAQVCREWLMASSDSWAFDQNIRLWSAYLSVC